MNAKLTESALAIGLLASVSFIPLPTYARRLMSMWTRQEHRLKSKLTGPVFCPAFVVTTPT